jgi:GalNAc5-diNAcBac-PP-undecaprenol beta-1,3-glucosyltransferase
MVQENMKPAVSIVLPTHNHGPMLLRSVGSAFAQTVQDFEIIIVGDGVTDDTRAAAEQLMRQDSRIQFLDYPKSPNYGEALRHVAVLQAKGEIICYLADDDLWLPDHIEEIQRQLLHADVTHALPVIVHTDGTFEVWTVDFSLPYFRDLAFKRGNRVPVACTAHTAEVYRRIRGWHTTPLGTGPILGLWLQFLALPGCRVVSGSQPTVLKFQSNDRARWDVERRVSEMDLWIKTLSDEEGRSRFRADVFDAVVRDRARNAANEYSSLIWRARAGLLSGWRQSLSWDTRERIKRIPIVGSALRNIGERIFGPIGH